jgi:hypothetical protein
MNIDEKEWRKLCQFIANEQDPHRLSELVDELIRTLDKRKQALYTHGMEPSSDA